MLSFTKTKINSRRKSRRTLLITILILLLAGYIYRERLQRILIAIVIYRENIFTPPPQITNESWNSRLWNKAQFYWDMSELRIARDKRLKQLNPSLTPLIKEINRRQAAGEAISYSMHIYREIRWRLNFTSDTVATRLRIDDLRNSISQPAEQKFASVQQASDGSWGAGITVWYLRFYYSIDNLEDSLHPQYRLSFLCKLPLFPAH
jgi:hypothetical protein